MKLASRLKHASRLKCASTCLTRPCMLLTWAAVPQGVRMPAAHELEPLEVRFPKFDLPLLQFLKARRRSLRRPPCTLVLASARSE